MPSKKIQVAKTPLQSTHQKVDANSPVPLSLSFRRTISILLGLHLLLVFVCMSANLLPSYSQQTVQRVTAPYLIATNLGLGMVPVELGHGTDFEGPFVFEIGSGTDDNITWKPLTDRKGLNESKERLHRMGRLLTHLGTQGEDDDAVAMLMTSMARHCRKKSSPGNEISHLRFLRKIIPSYQEFGASVGVSKSSKLETETLYQAQIIALSETELTLVPQLDPRRKSKVVSP